jgi:hypothetical protein
MLNMLLRHYSRSGLHKRLSLAGSTCLKLNACRRFAGIAAASLSRCGRFARQNKDFLQAAGPASGH